MAMVGRVLAGLIGVAIVAAIGWLVYVRLSQAAAAPPARTAAQRGAVPVELAPVEVGLIEHRRAFSGSLEATARVTLAPKVAGRIDSLTLDIGDEVPRGSVVARLDDAEFAQTVAQARAELAVAEAGLARARSAAEIAERENERVRALHERGIASDSQLDTAQADRVSRTADIAVAEAQVTRAEALVRSAEIRLGYATIRAEWQVEEETRSGAEESRGSERAAPGARDVDRRIVAERLAEPGDTVAANTPLLTLIEIDPIDAVVFATERDYADLAPGQEVSLTTDAFPGRSWSGAVSRVSPVFSAGSRQARIEIRIANPDGSLKPGMFVRIVAVFERVEGATIVPSEALVRREGRTVVFVADAAGETVSMVPVEVGVRDDGRVQVIGSGVSGRVVTLGQQLLDEGTPISVPEVQRGGVATGGASVDVAGDASVAGRGEPSP